MKRANYIYFAALSTKLEAAEPWIHEGVLEAASVNHYNSDDQATGFSESIINDWLDNKGYKIICIEVHKAEPQFLECNVFISAVEEGKPHRIEGEDFFIQTISYSGPYYIEWEKRRPEPVKFHMSDTPHPIVQC